MTVTQLPTLLTEAQAYLLYGAVLEDKELRQARQNGLLGYYRRKGQVLYRSDELVAFVEARLKESYVPPCQKNSELDAIGSTKLPDQEAITASPMSPELEKLAADRLRQAISRKPRSGSPRSSSRKEKLRLVSQET